MRPARTSENHKYKLIRKGKMILDIHTHHPVPQPTAVIDASHRPGQAPVAIVEGQCYSAGIHPYDTVEDIPEETWEELERMLEQPGFVAVGECGVDLSGQGGMMFRQLQIFRRQIEISERLKKPMIVHCVKGEDVVCGLRRDLQPKQKWVIHGFRRKPEAAQQLLRSGCWLSFGPLFNKETLISTPEEKILAETDAAKETIDDVILGLSRARGKDLRETIAQNTALFLGQELKV